MIYLFRLSTSSWFMFWRLYVSINFSISSGCSIFWHITVCSILMIFCISVISFVTFPFLFLILFILVLLLLFPSYLSLCGPFLQPWLYMSFPVNLQFVFSEKCSTWRCIFDVFVERGELCILLLHHLDLLLIYVLLLSKWGEGRKLF